jgi:all-trans-retinol 13,14-reductase
MREFDVVIIGSGLGGLLCGAVLSKNGFSVCIVERNKATGGNLQSFKKDGAVFNTGLHYFGSGDTDQFIYKLFNYLEIYPDLKLKRLDIDRFDVINFRNREYQLAQGFDNFSKRLLDKFPDEHSGISNFVSKIKQVGKSGQIFNLEPSPENDDWAVFNPLRAVNAYRFIESVTGNKNLRSVLAGLNDLLGGPREKINLYIFGMIYYTFIQSAWRFVDGSSQLAEKLSMMITASGGSILTDNTVNAFKMKDNGTIGSAVTDQRHEIFGKKFISDIHPFSTFDLLPVGVLRKIYTDRILSLENSRGMFTIYIVLKPETFPYLNYNYTCALTDEMWLSSDPEQGFPHSYWFETPAASGSEKFAKAATILSPVSFELFRKWSGTRSEDRGEDYEDFKKELAEKLLEKVFVQFPSLKSAIAGYYCSTPLTQIDYTGSPEGSAYGLIKDSEDPVKSQVLPKTRIHNLFLTGQNTNAHGMLGVSTGALITLSHITDMNKIIKEIHNAG